jgi:SAM-dependent methyltransferase
VSTSRRLAALFLLSVLGLFLELMLIRWVSTELRIFAYLQNTVLVVCFLGLGMGCWTCRRPVAAWHALLPLAVVVLFLAVPVCRGWVQDVTQGFTLLRDFPVWDPLEVADGAARLGKVAVAAAGTLVLTALLWHVFLPQGRLLGRLLGDDPRPLRAYSVNVAGSLVGIGLFELLSAARTPPLVWCGMAAALALPFLDFRRPVEPLLTALVLVLAAAPLAVREAEEVYWTPYQKLTVHEDGWARTVRVNGSFYFSMIKLDPGWVRAHPETYGDPETTAGYYDLPALLQPRPARALVVGAGGGNDVAGLLRGGARRVVAVEIDPAIIAIGRRYHPERPYDDPRVEVVNDDARAYFARSTEKFDLIVFGLLDAHTATALMNARLDHFVYTRESLAQAGRLLADGGRVILCFEAAPVQVARFDALLRESFAYHRPPFRVPASLHSTGGVVFIAGHRPDAVAERRFAEDPRLRSVLARSQPVEVAGRVTGPLPTDDWPYLYLERPAVPDLFGLLAILLAALYVYAVRCLRLPLRPRHPAAHPWHFFFLGAAFLLLETANISRAAVVLGNTWDVNAVIIAAVLLFVLLANAVASACPRLPAAAAYAGLLGSCVALYFLDLARFNGLPYAGRGVVVGLLACLPVFFSGLVFARSFAGTPMKDAALGANLLGALVGGLLQSLTFLIGIKALLLVVAGLYVGALLTRPRAKAGATR